MKKRRLLPVLLAKMDLKTSNISLNISKAANIHVNSAYPADLIYQNRMIGANVINPAYERVKRLLISGSAGVQPKAFDQPMLSHINAAKGKGKDSSIKEISETMKQVIGYLQSVLNGKS